MVFQLDYIKKKLSLWVIKGSGDTFSIIAHFVFLLLIPSLKDVCYGWYVLVPDCIGWRFKTGKRGHCAALHFKTLLCAAKYSTLLAALSGN